MRRSAIKPANVALTTDGHVKVLDFGLAKALEPVGAGAATLADAEYRCRAGLAGRTIVLSDGMPGKTLLVAGPVNADPLTIR